MNEEGIQGVETGADANASYQNVPVPMFMPTFKTVISTPLNRDLTSPIARMSC